MENNRLSPPPVVRSKTMTFFEAIKEAIKGAVITRESWTSDVSYAMFQDNFLMLYIKGEWHTWKISIGDLEGTDWIVML